MSPRKFLISALCIAVLVAVAGGAWAKEVVPAKITSQPAATQMNHPVRPAVASLDQRALDILKKMSETLSQAKSVRFETRSMVPIRSPRGMWVSLYGTSRVVKEGSEKLFAETRGDFFPYDFYFDGKTITAYSPTKNLYAEKSAPGTVEDVIEMAYREEGKSFPYADILVAEPYAVLTDGLVRAAYVGQSTFRALSGTGSVKTDHLAFSNKGVEWQIWIGVEDRLPRMVSATYFGKPGEPSYMVEFGDWKINEPVLPETFIFKNTSKAAKVEFRNPMQQGQGFSSGAANQQ